VLPLAAGLGFAALFAFPVLLQLAAPAVLVSKRPGGRAFYATIDVDGVRREETPISVDAFGTLMPGAPGVAYFRSGRLLGFRAVEVDR
jgi:hypothetical protein